MSNVTLNVADSVYFDSLNLSAANSWTSSGNFSFVENSSYSVNSKNEFGTINIGPIQIKFGYAADDSGSPGSNTVSFTNSFPTQLIVATGSLYNGGTVNILNPLNSGVTFTNGGGGNYVYWIAIGN